MAHLWHIGFFMAHHGCHGTRRGWSGSVFARGLRRCARELNSVLHTRSSALLRRIRPFSQIDPWLRGAR